jgi:hypothetical protein
LTDTQQPAMKSVRGQSRPSLQIVSAQMDNFHTTVDEDLFADPNRLANVPCYPLKEAASA